MSMLETEQLDKGDDKKRGVEGERQFLFVGINKLINKVMKLFLSHKS